MLKLLGSPAVQDGIGRIAGLIEANNAHLATVGTNTLAIAARLAAIDARQIELDQAIAQLATGQQQLLDAVAELLARLPHRSVVTATQPQGLQHV